MSIRGLLAGAIVLCLLAGAVYWSNRTKQAEEAKSVSASPKLVSIKDEDVRRVEVLRKDQPPVIAERDKSGGWQVTSPNSWRADADTVNSLVSAFTGLTQDRLVEEKAADLAQFGLGDPGLQIGITTQDGKKRILSIGDETPTGGGYFAKLDGDPRVFTIYSGIKSSLDKTAADLRDKRLLIFDDTKLTRVELTSKGQTIEFGKNAAGEWQIVKPRPLRADNFAVEEIVRKAKDARMETLSDEEAKAAPGKFASGARVAVVHLTDASGAHTLEVRKSGEDYYARGTAAEGVYKIAKDTGEAFQKGLDDFRNKKLFDFGFTEPGKVELRDGGRLYSFVKGGEKWWANGKEMDPTSVQSLIDKLRDLTAVKFADAGFTTPALEITVTSDNGKRVEKVLISKSGDRYWAKRENEPPLYELDGKRVEEIQRAAADVKEPPPPPKK